MTKKRLRRLLLRGKCLTDLFEFTDGQECIIYKGDFDKAKDKDIIYIPDLYIDSSLYDKKLNREQIDELLYRVCAKRDFLRESEGHYNIAYELFDFVDWQYPNIQDLLDCYSGEDDLFFERFGVNVDELSGGKMRCK